MAQLGNSKDLETLLVTAGKDLVSIGKTGQ
jgi:hypothetical protein